MAKPKPGTKAWKKKYEANKKRIKSTYACGKCGNHKNQVYHRKNSKIGKAHRDYEIYIYRSYQI